jgi:hypothetical protein
MRCRRIEPNQRRIGMLRFPARCLSVKIEGLGMAEVTEDLLERRPGRAQAAIPRKRRLP